MRLGEGLNLADDFDWWLVSNILIPLAFLRGGWLILLLYLMRLGYRSLYLLRLLLGVLLLNMVVMDYGLLLFDG